MKFRLFCLFVFYLNAFGHCATCPDQWHPYISTTGSKSYLKCIRYFDNPVNFSEAQYVCNEIYDGDLLSVNSVLEQKLLVQYLHGLLGFKRQPVCWLGGTLNQNSRSSSHSSSSVLSNQLKWLDGTQSKYHNFAFDPATQASSSSGEQGAPGMWSAEDCKLRDAGFVCQKRISFKNTNSIGEGDMDRSRNSNGPFAAVPQNQVSEQATIFLDVVGEQMNTIKELFDIQKKAMGSMISKFSKALSSNEQQYPKIEL